MLMTSKNVSFKLTTTKKFRPILAGSGPLFVNTGITLVYILGACLPWRWVCLICAIISLANVLMGKWIPETPAWLLNNGKTQEAEEESTISLNFPSTGLISTTYA